MNIQSKSFKNYYESTENKIRWKKQIKMYKVNKQTNEKSFIRLVTIKQIINYEIYQYKPL